MSESKSQLSRGIIFAISVATFLTLISYINWKYDDLQQQINQLRQDAGIIHATK